ncbi:MAG: efflux RND transporter permease subunit [Cytophagales bacterium]|nr:MAG: efflux RND transporter permease subunit [Cytophagales bacterium]
MTLTEIAIKRPSLIIVIFSVLTLGGIFAYQNLGYELMPDFSPPVITITTVYPGASPSEVENSVTKKIEDAVSGLENIDDITAKSLENASIVIVNFKHGTDLDLATQEAQRKIDNMKRTMPSEVQSPTISKIAINDQPILQVSVNSNLSDKVLFAKMKTEILPQLQQLKGVAQIDMLGGEERQIRVNVNKEKLQFYRISLLQVTQAIKQANMEFPTGKVKSPDSQMTVKLAGKFTSMDDLKNLVIFTPPMGSPIRLGEVADINDGVRDITSVIRFNGQNGIGLRIKKQADANAVLTAKTIRQKAKELEGKYAKDGLKFIIADDVSLFTLESVNAVTHDLEIAIVLVSLVMLLFLHSLRNSLIVMVSIPASLVSAILAMWLLGYTLNLMTLLAMSLVIGILVDDSIVVLENIYRHLEMGKDKRQAALDGRNEIGFSAVSITLVDVVVFLPITFVNTVIADILRQFSVIVVVSTLMSLFVCFTLTPWLASRFSQVTHLNPKNPLQWLLIQFEKGLDSFTNGYVKLVRWALNHKLITVGVIILLFVGIGQVMKLGILGQELVAQGDQGKFVLRMEYDKSTPLQRNNLVTKQIEDYILQKPEVDYVYANVAGSATGAFSSSLGSENRSEMTVQLLPTSKINRVNTEKYMIQVRKELAEKFSSVDISSSVIGLVNSGQAPIEIILSGENYEQVIATANKLKTLIVNTPGANDVQVSVQAGNPELRIELDREKMAQLGLNIATVGATLQNSFAGNDDSKFREGGNDYDIRVMLDAFDRKNPQDVKTISFLNAQGQLIRLEQFASITQNTSPSVLERKDRRGSVTVTSYNLGKGSGTVAQDIDKQLKANPLPAGIDLKWGGDIKRQNDSFAAMGLALLASLVLVYLIMVALYDNYIYPLVVLFSIPVAMIGALLALNLSMSNFSIFAGLGVIMLLGLVMKNAILIVDFTNHLKEKGMKTFDALLESVKERMRPILMTTVAMVFGMVPIAIAKGAGAEWKNGLAWVLIGGLLSSMFLTIVLVPVMYYTVDLVKEKLEKWFGGKKVVSVDSSEEVLAS